MAASGGTRYNWEELPLEELNPMIGRRLLTGERMMIAHVYLQAGAIVPRHEHDNEQLTYILEGTLRLWLGPDDDEEMFDVRAGEVLHIPPNVPHGARTFDSPCLEVDVFHPPRRGVVEAMGLDPTDG